MTKKEILENNALIATFMGWELHTAKEQLDQWEVGDCGGKISQSDIWVLNPTELFLEKKMFGCNFELDLDDQPLYDDWRYTMNYHNCWSQLMPVLEKIRVLSAVFIFPIEMTIKENTTISSPTICTVRGITIESHYKLITEFIKWYNTKK